jgi:hypothetical protein
VRQLTMSPFLFSFATGAGTPATFAQKLWGGASHLLGNVVISVRWEDYLPATCILRKYPLLV